MTCKRSNLEKHIQPDTQSIRQMKHAIHQTNKVVNEDSEDNEDDDNANRQQLHRCHRRAARQPHAHQLLPQYKHAIHQTNKTSNPPDKHTLINYNFAFDAFGAASIESVSRMKPQSLRTSGACRSPASPPSIVRQESTSQISDFLNSCVQAAKCSVV